MSNVTGIYRYVLIYSMEQIGSVLKHEALKYRTSQRDDFINVQ